MFDAWLFDAWLLDDGGVTGLGCWIIDGCEMTIVTTRSPRWRFLAQHPLSCALGFESETLFRQVVGQSPGHRGSGLGSDFAVLGGHLVTVGLTVGVSDPSKRHCNRSHKPRANHLARVEGQRAGRIITFCKTGRSPETVGLTVSSDS